MTYELIAVEEAYDGRVTEITLGPPPGNIVTAKMMSELKSALAAARTNKKQKLIVLGGSGKHFSFGASVDEHRAELVRDMLPRFHDLVGQMIECEVPILAKVSGVCLGGGFEIVLASTFVFADETASFGVPEIQLGVFPPVACVLLPLRCGEGLAAEMVLGGGRFAAKELRSHGLIQKVAETGRLDEEVAEFVKTQVLPKSASSLRIACRALRTLSAATYRERIAGLEKLYLDDLMSTRDAVEGIRAFLEKRPPGWSDE